MTRTRTRSTSAVTGWMLLVGLAVVGLGASWLAPRDPFAVSGAALAPPGGVHWFGTDDSGRDVFTGVVHGSWNSLRIGFVAGALAAILGIAIGGLAGIRGGWLDVLLMRVTEFAQALPRFFLVVTIVSLFGSQIWLIVFVLGLTAWPAPARVFRALVLSVMSRDFIVAARAVGRDDAGILLRHVLPLTSSVVSAQVSYQAGGAILAEAGLSFLGLGDPTVMSWGGLLGSAQHFVRDAWWMSVFPGAAVTLAVLGCNLIADALAERHQLEGAA